MDTALTSDDFLAVLFSGPATAGPTQAEIAAAELAAIRAEKASRDAIKGANHCPKCSGSGYLSQFAHRKCGECFTCGGTGVFARYSA
jgi:DnaJ-class molecular chaperone